MASGEALDVIGKRLLQLCILITPTLAERLLPSMKGENAKHSTKRKPGQCEKQILTGQRARR